jgi:hypothetical protein
VSDNPTIAAQLARIREEMQEQGHARVTCEELRVLCEGELSPARQLLAVAKIAQWEQWSFEFLEDGSVRFATPGAKG